MGGPPPGCTSFDWGGGWFTEKKFVKICPDRIDIMRSEWPDNVRLVITSPRSVAELAEEIKKKKPRHYGASSGVKLEAFRASEPHTHWYRERGHVYTTLKINYVCKRNGLIVSTLEYSTEIEGIGASERDLQSADSKGVEYCAYVARNYAKLIQLVNPQEG